MTQKKISLSFTVILVCVLSACSNSNSDSTSTGYVSEFAEIETALNDINTYSTTEIQGQTWLAQNLAVSTFRNGDTIFQATSEEEWVNAGDNNIPAWTHFDHREAYYSDECEVKFYNWHAVNDPRGLAPEGWRVPTIKDWDDLLKHYILYKEKIDELKSEENWDMDGRGNNLSGFNAKAYGYCGDYAGCANNGLSTDWWTSEEYNAEESWSITLNKYNDINKYESAKGAGFSVRLIKE
jgi:uncharacterized protein (TIGR02145 family)